MLACGIHIYSSYDQHCDLIAFRNVLIQVAVRLCISMYMSEKGVTVTQTP